MTSSGICGSDLHLYEVMGPFLDVGDVLGHEVIGAVEEPATEDLLPLLTMFDKQVQLRMGQANVRHWSSQILPLLTDDDPLHVDTFATHHLPLADGPAAYKTFQHKTDGAVKVLLHP